MDSNSFSLTAGLFSSENQYSRFYEYAHKCYAMVYVPPKPVLPKIGLFLFNAGHRYRTGPNDIYVKIGIELSQKGLYVITPDPEGMGDGFERFKFRHTQEHQNRIQKELYVDDAITSLQYFRQKLSLSKIVVSGLCGGTRTALSCANRWSGIDGLIAWCCPFQLSDNIRVGYSKQKGEKDKVTEIKENLKIKTGISENLKKKLWKLLSLHIDWRYHYSRSQRAIYKLANRDKSFDYKAVNLLKKMFKKKQKIIFIYSEKDFHYEIFRDYYLPWYGNKYQIEKITTVLRATNHVVGNVDSQRKLFDVMYNFCRGTK